MKRSQSKWCQSCKLQAITYRGTASLLTLLSSTLMLQIHSSFRRYDALATYLDGRSGIHIGYRFPSRVHSGSGSVGDSPTLTTLTTSTLSTVIFGAIASSLGKLRHFQKPSSPRSMVSRPLMSSMPGDHFALRIE